MNIDKLINDIEIDEDYRSRMYKCPAKKWTIGFGRNIEDNGIRRDEALFMLKNDIMDIKLELEDNLPFFYTLNDVRQNTLINMAYNLGVPRFMEFEKTLDYLKNSDYEKASIEMLDSKWHRDFINYAPNTPIEDLRSSRLAKSIKEGK